MTNLIQVIAPRFIASPLLVRSVIVAVTMSIALSIALTGAATAQEAQPDSTIAVEGDATTDAAIATRIRDILQELGRYGDVTVAVSSGIVTLRGETADSEIASDLGALVRRVQGVVAVENQVIATANIAEQLNPAVDRFVARLQQIVRMLPLFLLATVVGLLVTLIGLIIARRVRLWQRIAPNAFIAEIYRHAIRIAFGIAGLVVALDILNATALLGTILGAAGIIGLALGFAVRDTVENFIASVMLSIRQPFRPNDVVEINGDQGKVIRLTSRATILLSFDGNHIRIPNATVFKSRLVNFSRNAERRFLFQIGVEADSDLATARKLMEETVASLPFTLDQPAPNVWLEDITDSGVIFTVTGWINQNEASFVQARGEALRAVKEAVEAQGFAIPDTTYRIRLDSTGATVTEVESDARPAPRAPVSTPNPPGEVTVQADASLDRLIDAERSEADATDLLDKRSSLD